MLEYSTSGPARDAVVIKYFSYLTSTMIVIPGDKIPVSQDVLNDKKLSIGPSIYMNALLENELTITTPGVFTHKQKKNKQLVAVESACKSYVPSEGDYVIGTVTGAYSEYFKVSLNDFRPSAMLSYLAFENATKKNRPNLKVGSLVYAKVKSYNANIETEIECYNSSSGKSDGFGELTGGNLVHVNLAYARHLLFNVSNDILVNLGKKCEFEVAVGLNGKVWVKSADLFVTLACCEYIEKCQFELDLVKCLEAVFTKHRL